MATSSPTSSEAVQLLTRLLNEDPRPIDFDISILRSEEGGDPSGFVVKEDVHLAIHAGDLPWLARDFRQEYHMVRGNYRQPNILEQVTKCLLLVCPDHATAWADRKRVLLRIAGDSQNDAVIHLLNKEILFLDLLFTRHSKAPNSWAHRKWVVRKLLAINNAEKETEEHAFTLVQQELKLCRSVADRFPKNYFAWTHRIFVLDALVTSTQKQSVEGVQHNRLLLLFRTEWETVELWLKTHVSDHSAAHFGGQVLHKWLKLGFSSDTVGALRSAEEALESARRLATLHPTHEVIWIWRRICSHAFLMAANQVGGDVDQLKLLVIKQKVNCYMQEEITSLFELTQNASIEMSIAGDTSEIGIELEMTQRFRLSYILWIVEQAKRCKWIPNQRDIRKSLLTALAASKCPHNLYCNNSLFGTEY